MLFELLGAGVASWLAGESFRRGRRLGDQSLGRRRLGITSEEYARQLQEFRTRFQPPPSGGGPAPYVSCVPSYPDRRAIDNLCKILDSMGRAESLAEQEVYKDAFRTAWAGLVEGQKRCMEGWIRDACPRLEATLSQLQAIALPPAGPAPPPVRGLTPTPAVTPYPGGVPEFIYPSVTIPGPQPMPTPTSFVPSGMPKPGAVGPAIQVAAETVRMPTPTGARAPARPTVSVPFVPAAGGAITFPGV